MVSHKTTILAVGSNPASSAPVIQILTSAGYDVRQADRGEPVLSTVAADPPDLIVLNLRIEGMDGLEVVRRLKARRETQDIPIILITDPADVSRAVQGLREGASDYIARPMQPEELLRSVKTYLSLSHATALRRINEQLQSEVAERRRANNELRRSLSRAEGGRLKLLRALEDQARTEQALRESRTALQRAQGIARLATWIWHIRANRLEWSDGMYSIFGIDEATFNGDLADAIVRAVHPDDRAAAERSIAAAIQEKHPAPLECRIVWPDGTVRVVWAEAAEFILDAAGNPAVLTGIVQDITQRKQAEQALIDAERKWQDVLVGSAQLRITKDRQGKITSANPHFLALTGWQEDEVLGRDWFGMFIPEELQAEARGAFDAVMAGDDGTGFSNSESVIVTRAGDLRNVAWSTVLTRDAGGSVAAVARLGIDLTERRRAETDHKDLLIQVQEQARRIQGILDTVPEGVVLIEADGHVLLANPVAERDLAVLAGARPGDIIDHLGDRPLAELLTSPPTQGLWHEAHAGERIFEIIARPVTNGLESVHFVLVISDVTRARAVQTQLDQQERLAAIGQLTAGVAHDFNNVLAVIVLYAQMDALVPDIPDRLRAHLKTIGSEARHGADLIQQILDFSRRSIREPQRLDLVPLLAQRVKLLESILPENIRIDFSHPPDEVLVEADPTRLQQAVTNLAVNARDAMPQGGGLSIALEWIEIEPHQPPPLPGIGPGRWAKLAISDTGTGIAPEIRSRIFEPFFTTKLPGKGSGLGLPQVYGIVQQHGGQIGVQSRVGRGTTFTIYLPTLGVALPEAQPISSSTSPTGHGELILVVEDNAALRAAVVSTLEQLSYRVLQAANGREAIEIVEHRGEELAMILSDMVMPEMGGEALFYTLHGRVPALPMVIMTGHTAGHELAAMQAEGLAGWLTKPPVVAELATTLARALQRGNLP